MSGSTAANIGSINIGYTASFQVNGGTFNDVSGLPNYQSLVVENSGSFVISGGTFTVLNFDNSNLLTLSAGTMSGYGTISANLTNEANSTIVATGGVMTKIATIDNYGTINLAGVVTDSSVVDINNYGTINHSVGALNATNLNNQASGTYNLTGNASITPPAGSTSMTTDGIFLANTTGTIGASMQNGSGASGGNASLTITNLASVYNITNNAYLTINGPVSLTPQSNGIPSIANNNYMLLNNANITVTTTGNDLLNAGIGVIDITAPLTLNFSAGGNDITTGPSQYANFTNQGIVNLKATNGTITYANAGTNIFYVTPIGTLNVYTSSTLIGANYANYGVHYAYINSQADPSTFTVQGTADLNNCFINFDVNPSLSGSQSFKILDSDSIINPPGNSTSIDTFLLQKSISYNQSMIFVNYSRQKLTSFNLPENAMQLAQAIETLLAQNQLNNPNLNDFYQKLYTNVSSAAELETYLTNMLPIVTTPVQNAVVQQSVHHQIDNRMQAIRVAYNSGDYSLGFSPWMRYFSTHNHQGSITNNPGYKFKSHGLVFGMDNYDGLTSQYGLSLTIARSLLEQQTNLPSKSKTHFYQANVYSQNIRPSNYYTDWIIGLAYSTTDQSRVDASNNNTLAYSHYTWQQYSGKYEFGYIFDIQKEYYIVPYISGHYTFLKNYQYQEYNDQPNNLFIVSPAKHVFEVGLGTRADMHLLLYGRNFIPRVTLGVKYCLSSPVYTIDASIIDQSVVFQTFTQVPRLKYYAGLGATVEVIDNLNFSFNIEAETYTKYLGWSYNIMLRYLF
jgi:hypothetical protein